MKMKVTAYRNYGVLGHEKRPFYTINGPASTAVVSETVAIALPEGWKVVKNEAGTILFELPDGKTLIAEQTIDNERSSEDHAMFRVSRHWYDAEVESQSCGDSGRLDGKTFRIIGVQFPLEEGISPEDVILAMTRINCDSYDFYRVDGQASSAYFVFDSELFAEFLEQDLLSGFERFIQEILDDVNLESESGCYQFNQEPLWFGYGQLTVSQ